MFPSKVTLSSVHTIGEVWTAEECNQLVDCYHRLPTVCQSYFVIKINASGDKSSLQCISFKEFDEKYKSSYLQDAQVILCHFITKQISKFALHFSFLELCFRIFGSLSRYKLSWMAFEKLHGAHRIPVQKYPFR